MMPLLPLKEACRHIEIARKGRQSTGSSVLTGPLLQFWDAEPPEQVQRLLRQNATYCEQNDIEYVFFDDIVARDYLSGLGEPFLQAYTAAPHPAMKSDLLRLCWLSENGGYYLDADMAVRNNFTEVFDIASSGLVLQWDSHGRINCPNWFFGFQKGSPICRALAEHTAHSILSALKRGADIALRNILEVSGPGIFTRVVGTCIAHRPIDEHPSLMSVTEGYRYVQNGPELLGEKLEYKSTQKHWQMAISKQSG